MRVGVMLLAGRGQVVLSEGLAGEGFGVFPVGLLASLASATLRHAGTTGLPRPSALLRAYEKGKGRLRTLRRT
jgi:hypothetical protein